jgi:hypothetical protein
LVAVTNNAAPYADQIGRGWDSVFGATRRYFVTGNVIETRMLPDGVYIPSDFVYTLAETQAQYESATSFTAKAKGRAGLVKAKASLSTALQNANSSYAIHVCALARKVGPIYIIQNGTLALTEEARQAIQKARYKDHLLRDMGDSYISGVLPASELFIDLMYETASASSRSTLTASLKASYGGLVSGSATFSQMMSNATGHKNVKLTATGINGVSKDLKPEDVLAMSSDFFAQDSRTEYAIRQYPRNISELTLNGVPLDWVNQEALQRRTRFVQAAENKLQDLVDAAADSQYVQNNPAEFDEMTQSRARADFPVISRAYARIQSIVDDARREFEQNGMTTRKFDVANLEDEVPDLKMYLQIEPPPPPPAPAPATPAQPPERPRRPSHEGGADRNVGGGR